MDQRYTKIFLKTHSIYKCEGYMQYNSSQIKISNLDKKLAQKQSQQFHQSQLLIKELVPTKLFIKQGKFLSCFDQFYEVKPILTNESLNLFKQDQLIYNLRFSEQQFQIQAKPSQQSLEYFMYFSIISIMNKENLMPNLEIKGFDQKQTQKWYFHISEFLDLYKHSFKEKKHHVEIYKELDCCKEEKNQIKCIKESTFKQVCDSLDIFMITSNNLKKKIGVIPFGILYQQIMLEYYQKPPTMPYIFLMTILGMELDYLHGKIPLEK